MVYSAKMRVEGGKFLRFLKDWTLPSAMTLGAATYLFFANVPALNGFSRPAGKVIEAIFPVFMIAVLYTTFCKVNFRQLRPAAWSLPANIVNFVLILLSAAAVYAARVLADNPSAVILSECFMACAIAPTATAAAVVTAKLGGNLEHITSHTCISNFLTAFYVPVLFPLVAGNLGQTSFVPAFMAILWKVSVVLILPMLLAWLTKHFLPRLHARILSVRDLSFYLWGVSLAVVTGMTVKQIDHARASVGFLLLIAAVALFATFLQFALGRLVGRRYGAPLDAGQAVGQKNTAFAIWIAYTYLTPLCSVGPGCYILWQNIVNSWELRRAAQRK